MLAVISDLHFQDTVNDILKDDKGNLIGIDRNVPAAAFNQTFQDIISLANANNAKELKIVLAGDIFDIHRSQRWFENDNTVRPYGDHSEAEWGPIAEDIFDAIRESNKQAFDIFEIFAEDKLATGVTVNFIYIPGNHDRLINLYKPLISKVRSLFKLGGTDEKFGHEVLEKDYGVHIRHGHEYDPYNFAGAIPEDAPIVVNDKDYDIAPFGDYVTIDVAARLAYEYKNLYENDIMSGSNTALHQTIYRKLLEFDDLRPQSQILSFLQAEIDDKDKMMEYLAPILKDIIQGALDSNFVKKHIGSLEDIVGKVMSKISVEALFDFLIKQKTPGSEPWQLALREPVLNEEEYRYMVSGHTHNPDIEFLKQIKIDKE
jgi:UDP-2,3-diacylglucosamine pyrophosphatase LpxH